MSTNRIDGDYGEVVVPFGKHKGEQVGDLPVSYMGTEKKNVRSLGVCVECGESREDALVLHHKNGDGKEERQKLGSGGHYYSGLRKAGYPPGKDVMCGTCHLIHHRKEQREKYEKWPL